MMKNMVNVYEVCSKEETKTQYHFLIISNATVMEDSSLKEIEVLIKKE